MTLLQDGLIAFFSAVGVTTLVWIVAGAFSGGGGRGCRGCCWCCPCGERPWPWRRTCGAAAPAGAPARGQNRAGGLWANPGRPALAAYLADRDPGVALTDGAVIRLDENEHTKEEEHGRAGHL